MLSSRRREAACHGKRAYRSWLDATNAIRGLVRAHPGHGPYMAYRCPHCRAFHLGTSGRRLR